LRDEIVFIDSQKAFKILDTTKALISTSSTSALVDNVLTNLFTKKSFGLKKQKYLLCQSLATTWCLLQDPSNACLVKSRNGPHRSRWRYFH
jgi:hypothetical protein